MVKLKTSKSTVAYCYQGGKCLEEWKGLRGWKGLRDFMIKSVCTHGRHNRGSSGENQSIHIFFYMYALRNNNTNYHFNLAS